MVVCTLPVWSGGCEPLALAKYLAKGLCLEEAAVAGVVARAAAAPLPGAETGSGAAEVGIRRCGCWWHLQRPELQYGEVPVVKAVQILDRFQAGGTGETAPCIVAATGVSWLSEGTVGCVPPCCLDRSGGMILSLRLEALANAQSSRLWQRGSPTSLWGEERIALVRLVSEVRVYLAEHGRLARASTPRRARAAQPQSTR